MERLKRIGRRNKMSTPTQQSSGMNLAKHKSIGLGAQLDEFDSVGIGEGIVGVSFQKVRIPSHSRFSLTTSSNTPEGVVVQAI